MSESNNVPIIAGGAGLLLMGGVAAIGYNSISEINYNIERHEKVLRKVVRNIDGMDRKLENVVDDTAKIIRDVSDDVEELKELYKKLLRSTSNMRRDINYIMKKIDPDNKTTTTTTSSRSVYDTSDSDDNADNNDRYRRNDKSKRRNKRKDKKKKRRDEESDDSDETGSLNDEDVINRLTK